MDATKRERLISAKKKELREWAMRELQLTREHSVRVDIIVRLKNRRKPTKIDPNYVLTVTDLRRILETFPYARGVVRQYLKDIRSDGSVQFPPGGGTRLSAINGYLQKRGLPFRLAAPEHYHSSFPDKVFRFYKTL